MEASDVIEIIERRRAKFQAQRRPGPQEGMDETARLIAEEYDILLAEIEVALARHPELDRKNVKSEAGILSDRTTVWRMRTK